MRLGVYLLSSPRVTGFRGFDDFLVTWASCLIHVKWGNFCSGRVPGLFQSPSLQRPLTRAPSFSLLSG